MVNVLSRTQNCCHLHILKNGKHSKPKSFFFGIIFNLYYIFVHIMDFVCQANSESLQEAL